MKRHQSACSNGHDDREIQRTGQWEVLPLCLHYWGVPIGSIEYHRDRGKFGAENCGEMPVEYQKCRFESGQWPGSEFKWWQWRCMNVRRENYQQHDKSNNANKIHPVSCVKEVRMMAGISHSL